TCIKTICVKSESRLDLRLFFWVLKKNTSYFLVDINVKVSAQLLLTFMSSLNADTSSEHDCGVRMNSDRLAGYLHLQSRGFWNECKQIKIKQQQQQPSSYWIDSSGEPAPYMVDSAGLMFTP
ncbi:hypothetical protein PV325_012806, partial [Microctonus aethiopoides]